MEEDIKILEELKEHFIFNSSGFLSKTREEQKRIAYAIENLIKGYRELKEENSKIEYVEKEAIHNPNPENWDTKGLYTIRYHNRIDVIPKSKIKEKIEELKEMNLDCETFGSMRNYAILILQELMEDK